MLRTPLRIERQSAVEVDDVAAVEALTVCSIWIESVLIFKIGVVFAVVDAT